MQKGAQGNMLLFWLVSLCSQLDISKAFKVEKETFPTPAPFFFVDENQQINRGQIAFLSKTNLW